MIINKIGKISVYVEDQEQAKEFWLNKLGFVLKLNQWGRMQSGLRLALVMMNLPL